MLILTSKNSFSQNKNFNIALVLNEELLINVEGGKIKHIHNDNLYGSYVPGNIQLGEDVYKGVMRGEKYYFAFTVVLDYEKNIRKYYEIELIKAMLEHESNRSSFCVIEIFDLDIKKYKKKYNPIDKDKNYSYNVILPSYSIIRLK